MTTLELLQQRWKANSLPLEQVREHYFPGLKTEKRLRALIRSGGVNLATFKPYESRLAPWHVRLDDLAVYLDTRAATAA